MDTGSPSKHDRVERHLQRQRGAGARNLTTSFGFSFGLPVALPTEPTAEPLHKVEPLNKRRRLSHESDEASVEVSRHESLRVATDHGENEVRAQPRRRVQKRRLDAIPEEHDTVSISREGDSSVKAGIVAKKRGKPRKTVRDEFAITNTVVDAPDALAADTELDGPPVQLKKKRGRPKKNLVSNAEEQSSCPNIMALNAVPAAKKRGRPKKSTATTPGHATAIPAASIQPQVEISPAAKSSLVAPTAFENEVAYSKRSLVTMEPSTEGALRPGIARDEFVTTHTDQASVAPVKKASRTKSNKFSNLEQTESNKAVKQPELPNETATAKKRSFAVPNLVEIRASSDTQCRTVAEAMKQPEARPRRRAAADAMHKVSQGFIEEEIPIDKKRRDAASRPDPKRGGKVASATVQIQVQPLKSDLGRESAEQSTFAEARSPTEPAFPEKNASHAVVPSAVVQSTTQPKVRSRRRAAADAMSKVTQGFIEEEVPVEKKRCDMAVEPAPKRQRKATPVLAHESDQILEDDYQKSNKQPASATVMPRGTKLQKHDQILFARRPLTATPVNIHIRTPSTETLQKHVESHVPKARHRKQLTATESSSTSNPGRQRNVQKSAIPSGGVPKETVESTSTDNVDERLTPREIVPASAGAESAGRMTCTRTDATSSADDATRMAWNRDRAGDAVDMSSPPNIRGSSTEVIHASSEHNTLVELTSTPNDKVKTKGDTGSASERESKEDLVPPAGPPSTATNGKLSRRKAGKDRKLPTDSQPDEQDIDWLFSPQGKNDTIRRRAVRSQREQRPPLPSNTPDMDLDDMLSTIAGYAADKHRGQDPVKQDALRQS